MALTADPMPQSVLNKFLSAMETVYGPLQSIVDTDVHSWLPPSMPGAHRGRYLWTDAFGVVNFITLHSATSDAKYLVFAKRLVDAVHGINGKTRDGFAHLPSATESEPLKGGLRIGKVDDEDSSDGDGDGQYHHYLTLWMFALNRLSLASQDHSYNDLAISLARAIHPAFVVDRESQMPQMYWKVSIDLSHPLVSTSGNLDPVDGFAVFKLLQKTAGDESILHEEIRDYQKILVEKIPRYTSNDPLDLGMTLWTAHWLSDEEGWATTLSQKASHCLRLLSTADDYFDLPLRYRLAFREFGTVLGIKCLNQCNLMSGESSASPSHPPDEITRRRRDSQIHVDFCALARKTIAAWESVGVVPSPTADASTDKDLVPITCVMYAASLWPGGGFNSPPTFYVIRISLMLICFYLAFKKGYFEIDKLP